MGVHHPDKAIKRAPEGFEDEEDDVGDVEENLNRGRPGPRGGYQTQENQNRGMQIDQNGTQRKRRASASCKIFPNPFNLIYSQEKK